MSRCGKLAMLILMIATGPVSWAYSRSDSENLRFRNIFATVAGGQYTQKDLSRMLLKEPGLPADFMSWFGEPESFFAKMENHLRSFGPEDLFRQSLSDGFRILVNLESEVQNSKDHKITFIMMPGFLSEFIDEDPFQKVLDQGDAFKRIWHRAVDLAPAELRSDQVFSLGELEYHQSSLKDLVKAGQISHPDGTDFIQYLYMKSPVGSLETMMNLADRADVMKRRLEKILRILPDPGHVYLMGYSLGGNTALQVLAEGSFQQPDYNRAVIEGFIGLGTPAWGSSMTDISETQGTSLYELKNTFRQIVKQIEAPSSAVWYQIPAMMISDLLILKNEVMKLRQILMKADRSELNKTLAGGDDKTDRLHGGSVVKLMKRLLVDHLKIQYLFTDYLNFKRRIKIVAENFLQTIEGLSPQGRETWWRHHNLPSSLRYVTLSGVMHQESDDSGKGLGTYFMGPETQDFQALLQSYRMIADYTGVALNDSQVGLHRSKLWPLLHRQLNPSQENYQVTNLGVLGSHHWGISFPVAFKGQSGRVNPFPRNLVLKSLGYYLLNPR